ncbi:hypothetical protein SNARM312S_04079 [Streptomyces narbonensis]
MIRELDTSAYVLALLSGWSVAPVGNRARLAAHPTALRGAGEVAEGPRGRRPPPAQPRPLTALGAVEHRGQGDRRRPPALPCAAACRTPPRWWGAERATRPRRGDVGRGATGTPRAAPAAPAPRRPSNGGSGAAPAGGRRDRTSIRRPGTTCAAAIGNATREAVAHRRCARTGRGQGRRTRAAGRAVVGIDVRGRQRCSHEGRARPRAELADESPPDVWAAASEDRGVRPGAPDGASTELGTRRTRRRSTGARGGRRSGCGSGRRAGGRARRRSEAGGGARGDGSGEPPREDQRLRVRRPEPHRRRRRHRGRRHRAPGPATWAASRGGPPHAPSSATAPSARATSSSTCWLRPLLALRPDSYRPRRSPTSDRRTARSPATTRRSNGSATTASCVLCGEPGSGRKAHRARPPRRAHRGPRLPPRPAPRRRRDLRGGPPGRQRSPHGAARRGRQDGERPRHSRSGRGEGAGLRASRPGTRLVRTGGWTAPRGLLRRPRRPSGIVRAERRRARRPDPARPVRDALRAAARRRGPAAPPEGPAARGAARGPRRRVGTPPSAPMPSGPSAWRSCARARPPASPTAYARRWRGEATDEQLLGECAAFVGLPGPRVALRAPSRPGTLPEALPALSTGAFRISVAVFDGSAFSLAAEAAELLAWGVRRRPRPRTRPGEASVRHACRTPPDAGACRPGGRRAGPRSGEGAGAGGALPG